MNYAFTSKHLSGSIYVNLLNYLKLYLNFLLLECYYILYTAMQLCHLHYIKKSLIKADIDIPKVISNCI